MKTRHALKIVMLLFGGSLLLFSCSKGSSTSNGYGNNTNNNNPAPPPSGNNVGIASMKFGPASLTVKAGTTVTWTNNDNMVHTVTADDGSFTSGDMNYGSTYSHTFNTVGTVAYHCTYHAAMKAAVVVN
jgi:plastocyanin